MACGAMENRGAQIDPLDSLQHGRQELHEFETGRRARPLPVTRRLHASSSAPSSEGARERAGGRRGEFGTAQPDRVGE